MTHNITKQNTTQHNDDRKYQRSTTQRNTREPTQDNTAGKKAKQLKQSHPKHKARTAQSKATQLNGEQQNTNNKRQERKHDTTRKTQHNERELKTTSKQNRYNA